MKLQQHYTGQDSCRTATPRRCGLVSAVSGRQLGPSHLSAQTVTQSYLQTGRLSKKQHFSFGVEQLARCTTTVASAATSEIDTEAKSSSFPYQFGVHAEQGLREQMEDEVHVYYDEQHGHLYIGVYDGHGGQPAAQWLKKELHNYVSSSMEVYLPHKQAGVGHKVELPELTETLIKSFESADEHLLQHLETLGGESQAQAGSTATVALVKQDRVVLANVGDSQGFLYRKGQPLALSTPHRVYGQGDFVVSETARVKSSGGWIHDGRVCNILAVSRAFGDWEFKGKGLDVLLSAGIERGYWPASFARSQKFVSSPVIVTPDATDTEITEDDEFMVVSTDGLWDVMPPQDALKWAQKQFQAGNTPQEVAESLVAIALKRYTTDNTSAVVVDLKGPEYWKNSKNIKKKSGGGFFNFFGR